MFTLKPLGIYYINYGYVLLRVNTIKIKFSLLICIIAFLTYLFRYYNEISFIYNNIPIQNTCVVKDTTRIRWKENGIWIIHISREVEKQNKFFFWSLSFVYINQRFFSPPFIENMRKRHIPILYCKMFHFPSLYSIWIRLEVIILILMKHECKSNKCKSTILSFTEFTFMIHVIKRPLISIIIFNQKRNIYTYANYFFAWKCKAFLFINKTYLSLSYTVTPYEVVLKNNLHRTVHFLFLFIYRV